ncbi:MAG: hypothetical protein J3K34DRAFT_382042 [Monoraphidium minutum]|nr:MAG: hypothetical protein J3K34DRAFT_382042 [Monoraphidium minutum]
MSQPKRCGGVTRRAKATKQRVHLLKWPSITPALSLCRRWPIRPPAAPPAHGPATAARRRLRTATSAFVGPTGAAADDDALMFDMEREREAAGQGAAPPARDLSLEALLADVRDLAAPPPGRDPLRGLRAAVDGHVSAAAAAAGTGPQADADGVGALAEAIAELLANTGAAVAVRAHTAAPPGAGARGGGAAAFVLRGRFVVIKGGDEAIIVDPSFREAFRTAPSTPGYAAVVSSLPAAFVGDAHALRRLVALVTAQAARSYAAQGLSVPPWRRFSAMMARWVAPRGAGGGGGRFVETLVTPPSSPLRCLGSADAAAAARAAAGDAARGALARLAALAAPPAGGGGGGGAGAAPPARVVRGFDLPPAPVAIAAA